MGTALYKRINEKSLKFDRFELKTGFSFVVSKISCFDYGFYTAPDVKIPRDYSLNRLAGLDDIIKDFIGHVLMKGAFITVCVYIEL